MTSLIVALENPDEKLLCMDWFLSVAFSSSLCPDRERMPRDCALILDGCHGEISV